MFFNIGFEYQNKKVTECDKKKSSPHMEKLIDYYCCVIA